MNYVSGLRPGPDAGEFASGGMMVKEGRVLYKDIFEVRPPTIYMLNALALSVGDGTFHSIRVLERVFAVAGALLVFFIVLTVFERRSLAAVIAIAYSFHAFRDPVFEQGNVTEEYAIVFVLAGILCTVRAVLRDDRLSSRFSVLSGVFFSCAILTKEPFVFSAVPWFVLLVSRPRFGWRPAIKRGLLFAAGGLIPLSLFLGYLTLGGAGFAWLDKFSAGLNYVALSGQQYVSSFGTGIDRLSHTIIGASRTGPIALALGGYGVLLFPRFLIRYGYVPLVFPLAFVMEYLGATMSSRLYGHYFLQLIPSFILCCASGGALVLYVSDRVLPSKVSGRGERTVTWGRGTIYRWGPALLIILFSCFLDSSVIVGYWRRLNLPFVRPELGPLSSYVKTNAEPSDHLWVTSAGNSRFYIETGLTSPIDFHAFYPGWLTDSWRTTGEEKVAGLRSRLADNQPAWLVLSDDVARLRSFDLFYWVCGNYVPTPIVGQGYGSPAHLYVRNDRAAELGRADEFPDDAVCSAEHINRSLSLYLAGEFRESLLAAEKALANNPTSAIAYNNICAAHLQLREFDDAIAACGAALVIDPDFARAKGNLAAAQAARSREPG